MAVKSSQNHNIDLALSGQLVLTPQLRQAINILNMSTLDLNQEIREMLMQNFMLRMDDQEFSTTESETERENEDGGMINQLDENLEYDSSWDDFYDTDWQDASPYREDESNIEEYVSAKPSLQEYLLEQLEQMNLAPNVALACNVLLYFLDEDGYFREDIATISKQYKLTITDLKNALETIKGCQPTGVGASSLQECLAMQVALLPENTPDRDLVKRVVDRYFYFINQDTDLICERLNISEEHLAQIIKTISSLNPRPGTAFQAMTLNTVKPDIIVHEKRGISYVELNRAVVRPELEIDQKYADLLKQSLTAQEKTLLRTKLAEAKWFLTAIDKRADTIQRVAAVVVALQQDFFQEGEKAMIPLTRQQVASKLDIHESTVSRAINGKYLMCKRGIFELRYFFNDAIEVETEEEPDSSTVAIKTIIKDLISNEDRKKPLSDQKITDLLKKEGYVLVRRTVTKYREELGFATSYDRRLR